jgi:nucleoside-diphosphate-sugar epimerase
MRALITGGAGYVGSLLGGRLLAMGHKVTVVDSLLFGGDAILGHLAHPAFAFHRRDVAGSDIDDLLVGVDIVYHLAAIVGFPACRDAGEAVSRHVNVEATKRVFEAAERAGVPRFVLASTYSNYGRATDQRPVTEESDLHPLSTYAETKIEAERYLLGRSAEGTRCAPIIPRFTTLFGISPRTRFDLMVNQFVLGALAHRRLVIYERNYRRSFVHVRDVVRALLLFAEAPIDDVRCQIFNVGNDAANHSKDELVEMVCTAIPGTEVEYRDLTFSGDMRDVAVSSTKIRDRLGFVADVSVPGGIAEVRDAIASGLIRDPGSSRYRNHSSVVS